MHCFLANLEKVPGKTVCLLESHGLLSCIEFWLLDHAKSSMINVMSQILSFIQMVGPHSRILWLFIQNIVAKSTELGLAAA